MISFEEDNTMKDRLTKLLTVKSLVTLALTVVFCVLALTGKLTGRDFLTIFTTVIAFYFGTQAEKKNSEKKEAE
jgi:preprotein translocase subunit SecY